MMEKEAKRMGYNISLEVTTKKCRAGDHLIDAKANKKVQEILGEQNYVCPKFCDQCGQELPKV